MDKHFLRILGYCSPYLPLGTPKRLKEFKEGKQGWCGVGMLNNIFTEKVIVGQINLGPLSLVRAGEIAQC